MKKIFLVRRNSLFKEARISRGMCVGIVVFIFLMMRIFAPNLFGKIFAPVLHITNTIKESQHAFFLSFKNTSELALQNERLVQENKTLMSENQALLKENASIAKLVSVSDVSNTANSASSINSTTKKILARVISRPPESSYDTLVISKGSTDGITVNMKVFGDGGVPLGVVSKVSNNSSIITLFSSYGSVVDGSVGATNFPVTINGAGGGVMQISVPRSAGIVVGDAVFVPSSSGLSSIGVVTRIDTNQSSPSEILRITPSLNPFSVSWVTVI